MLKTTKLGSFPLQAVDRELPLHLCLQYFLLASHQWLKVLIPPGRLLVIFGPLSKMSNSVAAVLQTGLVLAAGVPLRGLRCLPLITPQNLAL